MPAHRLNMASAVAVTVTGAAASGTGTAAAGLAAGGAPTGPSSVGTRRMGTRPGPVPRDAIPWTSPPLVAADSSSLSSAAGTLRPCGMPANSRRHFLRSRRHAHR